LCAEQNMQVVQPTTPAQIYHVLRRQMIRQFRKPLVIMTPKSLLRHKMAVSPLEDLAKGRFKTVIGETTEIADDKVKRVVACSGRVYYDLLAKRDEMKANIAIMLEIATGKQVAISPKLENNMSIVEVKVPQLSESVAEATLLEWKKQIGQAVKQDETLIEVETDKVILEVPSPGSGVLVEIIAPNGATVTAEQVIAKIDTAANASAGAASATAATAPATATATIPAPSTATAAPAANTASTTTVMPAAAKLIAENNVSVASGTGKDGRVTKGDVLAALSNPPANVPKVPQAQSAMPEIIAVTNTENLSGRPEERVPMSRLRARIAERLVLSQQTNAILTTFNEVNMQPVMDLRNKFKEQFEKNHGVKLGFMSFFVKA
ncbi:unnamed protein product, partial [Darwinula stevensoni]